MFLKSVNEYGSRKTKTAIYLKFINQLSGNEYAEHAHRFPTHPFPVRVRQ